MPSPPPTAPPDGPEPRGTFLAARAAAEAAARAAARRATRLSVVRLVSFFAGVALVVLLALEVHPGAAILVAAAGIAAFNQLVGRQQAADRERDRQHRIAALNDGELASLDLSEAASCE